MRADWSFVGRPKQQAPPGDWTYWLLLAGRGFGKTISMAQWARKVGLENRVRFALVAPTFADGRDTQVEGETGLLSILTPAELRGGSRARAWNRSVGELYLANGTKYKVFSSEEPDRLRGPQHHYAWCEEVSSFKDARRGDALETTWSNVKIGTRLGDHPRIALTSTPKANKLTKELVALAVRDAMALVRGSSYENRDNLAEAYWQEVIAPYEGTRLGRQEIEAELLEDVEGALWTAGQLDTLRVRLEDVPPMRRVVVGVDPNASSSEAANDAGIIVAGTGASTNIHYVLDDRTITRGGPAAWAAAVVEAYHHWEADMVIAEGNNGGDMVKMVIQSIDPAVPVKIVSASRGKRTRAEPISTLYEGDPETNPPKVRHAGTASTFADLEGEMTTWVPDPSMDSPNRMDALVWALTDLHYGKSGPIRMRTSLPPRGRRIPTAADRFQTGYSYGT